MYGKGAPHWIGTTTTTTTTKACEGISKADE